MASPELIDPDESLISTTANAYDASSWNTEGHGVDADVISAPYIQHFSLTNSTRLMV